MMLAVSFAESGWNWNLAADSRDGVGRVSQKDFRADADDARLVPR